MMLSLSKYPYTAISLVETDSTNNYLKKQSTEKELEEFTIVASEFQTSGKGQRGNSWESENGKNLLFSILLYPSFLPVNSSFMLSEIISISIKEEFDSYGDNFCIKWPNDIYWKERKIGGILIENNLISSGIHKSIIGVGLNINQTIFKTPSLKATSLKQITTRDQIRSEVLTRILNRFIYYYRLLEEGGYALISEKYHSYLYRKEGYHTYKDKEGYFNAKIIRVENSGTLILENENREHRKYLFKEVSFE